MLKDNSFHAYAEAGRFSYVGTSVDACASGYVGTSVDACASGGTESKNILNKKVEKIKFINYDGNNKTYEKTEETTKDF